MVQHWIFINERPVAVAHEENDTWIITEIFDGYRKPITITAPTRELAEMAFFAQF